MEPKLELSNINIRKNFSADNREQQNDYDNTSSEIDAHQRAATRHYISNAFAVLLLNAPKE